MTDYRAQAEALVARWLKLWAHSSVLRDRKRGEPTLECEEELLTAIANALPVSDDWTAERDARVRREALEEAAEVAAQQAQAIILSSAWDENVRRACGGIAAAIRALASK